MIFQGVFFVVNGVPMMCGGRTSTKDVLSICYHWSKEKRSWIQPLNAKMKIPRWGHSAVKLSEEKVIIVGKLPINI